MSKQFTIHGHRGARGHFPENTLPAFTGALDLGADTIELDVIISGDGQVVVSHEPWMNEDICSLPDGSAIKPGTGLHYNLFRMSYEQIKQFDCGKRKHPDFPLQATMPCYKPLLGEVIKTVEALVMKKGLKHITYNIELKTEKEDQLFNPHPQVFVDIVYRELTKYDLGGRFYIQSFDVNILQEMRKKDGAVRLGLLVENSDDLETNVSRLGFLPYAYNPEFILVNERLVKSVHEKNIKLFPWTVNEKRDITRMLALGVDGVISDYPERVEEVIKEVKR